MTDVFVNITRVWSLANSIELILFAQGTTRHQVLLQVSRVNSNETFYVTKTFSEVQAEDPHGVMHITVKDLQPLTEYLLCPSIIDNLGRLWHEGDCKRSFTVPVADCRKALITSGVSFGLVLLIVIIGCLGYRYFEKNFKRGFNLNSDK